MFCSKRIKIKWDFFDRTFLLDLRQGSELSRTISDIRYDSYENALGEKVKMPNYHSKLRLFHLVED